MIGADPFSQLFVVFSRQSEHRPAGLLVVEKYPREMVSKAFPLAQAQPKIPVLIVDTQGFVVPANQFPVGTPDQAGIDAGVPVEQTVEVVVAQTLHVAGVTENTIAVSYTHLTLPTNREVEITVVAAALKKKKKTTTQ